ncbi:MAG TPA: hypothetical protein VN600_15755 [Gemmatimonadaceae bacterium]|nr:hypothetical protein [Gemmatimonadaceae bacterium]
MRRPRLASQTIAVLSLCAATIAVACVKGPTDGSVTLDLLDPTDTAIAGSYDLVAINGQPLPSTTKVNASQAIEVDAERIVIGPDRSWADTSTTVVVDLVSGNGSPPTQTISAGTLNITAGTINFVTTTGGGSAFKGSVNKDTLTVLFTGTRFIYVK